MQNGFVARGGSYDRLGMNTPPYREIIPRLKDLIDLCKSIVSPCFILKQLGKLVG
jgi:ureidoacrylate peracid hydrolase